jgi:WD40 repeat protein
LAPIATAEPSLTSEPGELAILRPVISAENLSTITVTQVLQFSPWELVLALAWSPDGQRLAIAAGENVFIYQGDLLEKQRAIRAPVWNTSLAFDPSGGWLAGAGRDGHVRTWNSLTGEPGLDITAHAKGANHVTYNPNGSILASSGNDAVSRTWDSASGAKLGEIIGGTFAVPSFVFTSDGEYIGLTNGSLVRFRQVTSERFAFTVYGSGWFHSLAISADGRWLATGEVNNQVQIWDLSGWQNGERQTEQSYASASAHQGVANTSSALVWQVNFHPSGELLVSAGGDKTARIWQAPGGSLLATLHGQRLAITSAAFSPDGRRLATGSLDGSVWIWEAAGQVVSASGGSAAP